MKKLIAFALVTFMTMSAFSISFYEGICPVIVEIGDKNLKVAKEYKVILNEDLTWEAKSGEKGTYFWTYEIIRSSNVGTLHFTYNNVEYNFIQDKNKYWFVGYDSEHNLGLHLDYDRSV